MAGLVRPVGAVKIEKTEMVGENVLMATLSGAVQGTVAVVRKAPDDYHVVPPNGVGDPQKVPADSLTDGLHQVVFEMGENVEKARRKSLKKKNRGGRKR